MGRPRKSEKAKQLSGTIENDRRDAIMDLEVQGGQVQPPDWLSAAAIQVWASLEEPMLKSGLLTSVDVETFGRYCELSVMWQTEKKRRKNRDNRLILNLTSQLTRMAKELGMSPAARTSITVPAPKDQDDLELLRSA